jgi:hypothetical protein
MTWKPETDRIVSAARKATLAELHRKLDDAKDRATRAFTTEDALHDMYLMQCLQDELIRRRTDDGGR